jgi:hypothetical protein
MKHSALQDVPGCTLEERQRVSPTRTVVTTNAAHPEEPDHRYTHLCERWQGSLSDAEDLPGAQMAENLERNLAELAECHFDCSQQSLALKGRVWLN